MPSTPILKTASALALVAGLAALPATAQAIPCGNDQDPSDICRVETEEGGGWNTQAPDRTLVIRGSYEAQPADSLYVMPAGRDAALSGLRLPGTGSAATLPPMSIDWMTRKPDEDTPVQPRTPGIEVSPAEGTPGSAVRLEMDGFVPEEEIGIGVGPAESEWSFLEDVRADEEGHAELSMRLPDRYRPDDELIFVAEAGNGIVARSKRFRVIAEDPSGMPNERVSVTGQVTDGVECPIVTTDDGTVYSLASAGAISVATGVRAHVEGRLADMSFCQQGKTIEVGLFEQVDPQPLTQDYVVGAWVPKGGDCASPAFRIERNSAGGQVVDARVDGEERTGYVQIGPDPHFIFDRPTRELPLEARRAESLAVLPPESGSLELSGLTLEGDGTVFIKCAPEFVPGDTDD